MKPRFVILSAVTVATIFATLTLFLDKTPTYTRASLKAPLGIEIKWGEGSEASIPSVPLNP
jgi:hypothetical protein